MEINELKKLNDENFFLTKQLINSYGKSLELKKKIEQNEKKIKDELFSKKATRYHFNEIENIVYYFNKVKKIKLTVIAESLGYNLDYIRQISVIVNEKINNVSL